MSWGRNLNVLTRSVVRPVYPGEQIVKRVMPDSNSRVREDIDVKGKDFTLASGDEKTLRIGNVFFLDYGAQKRYKLERYCF